MLKWIPEALWMTIDAKCVQYGSNSSGLCTEMHTHEMSRNDTNIETVRRRARQEGRHGRYGGMNLAGNRSGGRSF